MNRLILLPLLFVSLIIDAQGLSIVECFKNMPDSVMPYLTHNNKLDMIDFLDAKMEAKVENRLHGTSEMTSLSKDTISLKMSDALRVDLFLVEKDSTLICMKKTYIQKGRQTDVVMSYYSTDWSPLYSVTREENLLLRDDEVFKDVHL